VASEGTSAGPIVVLAGSPALETRRQLAHLGAQQSVRLVRLPQDRWAAGAERTLVVATTPENDGAPASRDRVEYSQNLATAAAVIATATRPRAVVMVGGASARAICRALGVRAIAMLGETRVGLPFGRLRGGVWDGVDVVTKPGGFGAPDLLSETVGWLLPNAVNA
jgi:uncharacterized protein YgbK (DUF1537 family)